MASPNQTSHPLDFHSSPSSSDEKGQLTPNPVIKTLQLQKMEKRDASANTLKATIPSRPESMNMSLSDTIIESQTNEVRKSASPGVDRRMAIIISSKTESY